MAVLVPTATRVISLGNVNGVLGTFSAVGNADTWVPGLSTVDGAFLEAGASGQTHGLTYSGGTITVAASGALGVTKILAIGT
jgi:hypothetical protein